MAQTFDADVIIIGENHENPHHHDRQAELVAEIAPKALVFEMLTPAQAEKHVSSADQATLAAAFDWAGSGWPDFAMYYPIFAAAPDARVFGAGVPGKTARYAVENNEMSVVGPGLEGYGLTRPLPQAEQSAREARQLAAHCDALPEQVLPLMVSIQRLRDAVLARETLRALNETAGPVVVITGNGHARVDWGIPVYLRRVNPDVRVLSIGLSDGPPTGLADIFDHVEELPDFERPDPCAAFQ